MAVNDDDWPREAAKATASGARHQLAPKGAAAVSANAAAESLAA